MQMISFQDGFTILDCLLIHLVILKLMYINIQNQLLKCVWLIKFSAFINTINSLFSYLLNYYFLSTSKDSLKLSFYYFTHSLYSKITKHSLFTQICTFYHSPKKLYLNLNFLTLLMSYCRGDSFNSLFSNYLLKQKKKIRNMKI